MSQLLKKLRLDDRVFCMGEDIRHVGGIWGHTAGLYDEFGAERIIDTPISETGFIGAGVGAAIEGMRPIVDLMFVDFFGVCMGQIYSAAGKPLTCQEGKYLYRWLSILLLVEAMVTLHSIRSVCTAHSPIYMAQGSNALKFL